MNVKIPYEEIVERLAEKSNLSKEEIESRIDAKLKQLSGLISKEGAGHIIANELGVMLVPQTEGPAKIKDIFAGMKNINVVGKVTAVYDVREFQKQDRTGKVGNFFIGDETGTIRIVAWGAQADKMGNLQQNDVVRISSGLARTNNDRVEVHLNDIAELEINPEGVSIEGVQASARPEATRKKINELGPQDTNVEILGHIVQMFDPKFFEVCPKCGKRVRAEENFKCPEHGEVEPDYAYLINFSLDDGSENIRVVCFRNQVDQLMQKERDEMITYRESPEKFTPFKNDMLGNLVKIRGKASQNQMFDRLEFVAQYVDPKPDPEEELKNLA